MYASDKAGAWVYDPQGYCPFTSVRLEGVIRRAYEDGAASAMSTGRLTAGQREVLAGVLSEQIATLTNSTHGTPSRDSVAKAKVLERVLNKLAIKDSVQENTNCPTL